MGRKIEEGEKGMSEQTDERDESEIKPRWKEADPEGERKGEKESESPDWTKRERERKEENLSRAFHAEERRECQRGIMEYRR